MVTPAILMLASSVTAEPCDLAAIKTARASYEALSRRAVQVIALAVPKSSRSGARLKTLVDPSASFALGAGDVGRPLGSGIAGVSALARTMNADRFQYQGWDYMDGPAEACASQKVTIDFLSSADHSISRVEFTFDRGRMASGKGWQRSLESGPIPQQDSSSKGR